MAEQLTIPARGYISSASFRGQRVPQHIQNLVIRKYCDDNGLRFILSRAEYSFKKSYSQLWAAVREDIDNIVFYSIFQLPEDPAERDRLFSICINGGIRLHFAAELEVLNSHNAKKIDETLRLVDEINSTSDVSVDRIISATRKRSYSAATGAAFAE